MDRKPTAKSCDDTHSKNNTQNTGPQLKNIPSTSSESEMKNSVKIYNRTQIKGTNFVIKKTEVCSQKDINDSNNICCVSNNNKDNRNNRDNSISVEDNNSNNKNCNTSSNIENYNSDNSLSGIDNIKNNDNVIQCEDSNNNSNKSDNILCEKSINNKKNLYGCCDNNIKIINNLNSKITELTLKNERLISDYKYQENELRSLTRINTESIQKAEKYYESKYKSALRETQEIKDRFAKLSMDLQKEKIICNLKMKKLDKKIKEEMSEEEENVLVNFIETVNGIKNTLDELKARVQKFNSRKYMEIIYKSINLLCDNLLESIKRFNDDKSNILTQNYNKKIKNLLEENGKYEEKYNNFIAELENKDNEIKVLNLEKDNLMSKIKKIEDNLLVKENYIRNLEEKMLLIESRMEQMLKEHKRSTEKMNEMLFNYKTKEDEVECLIMIMDSVLNKKKVKYYHNLDKLTKNVKENVQDIVTNYFVFSSKN